MPLQEGPGIVTIVDYLGPLPIMPQGNSHILLITDRLSLRADTFSVSAPEFTAEDTVNILVTSSTSLWGVVLHHTL